jgi:hypothetical protein
VSVQAVWTFLQKGLTKMTKLKTCLYKACSRCGGDLVLESEIALGTLAAGRIEYVCLQCGRRAVFTADARRSQSFAARAA